VFANAYGINGLGGPKSEWPKSTKKKPPKTYSDRELKSFFDMCGPDDLLLFQFFLGSGFREAEMSHLPWRNVDLDDGTARITDVKVKASRNMISRRKTMKSAKCACRSMSSTA
jgi:integrase